MIGYISKRDGKIVKFDKDKIVNAIIPAMKEADMIDYHSAISIATKIEKFNNEDDEIAGVEQIQDKVEELLMQSYPDAARKYISYRNERTRARNMHTDLMKHIKQKVMCTNIINSNANVDEYSFGGRKNEAAGEMMKEIAMEELLDPTVKEYVNNNLLYIHDFTEYPLGDHNCLNANVQYMLHNGFNTRNGGVRRANSFSTACQLLAVIFQITSQSQYGGVGTTHIDYDMAPFVRKSFLKYYKEGLEYVSRSKSKNYDDFKNTYGERIYTASILAKANIFKNYASTVYKYAVDMLEKEGKQSAQGLYHNLNTLESRPGSQLPFSSINFGLNTSEEGRMVSRWMLEASLDGIGKFHQVSIFPISIFQFKTDINDREGTPNYDLFKLAIKSTCQTIYPNYANCDWSTNVPDIHPTYIIDTPFSKNGISESKYVVVQVHLKSSKYRVEDKICTLKDLFDYCLAVAPSEYVHKDVVDKDTKKKFSYVDTRFLCDKIYINDKDSWYKPYNLSIEDHIAKVNYIAYADGKVSITTDTFRYDYSSTYKETGKMARMVSSNYHHKYDNDTEMATMGSCDGKETISGLFRGEYFSLTFEEVWDMVVKFYGEEKVNRIAKTSYIDTPDLKVDDISIGINNITVNANRIIRNDDIGVWNKVTFKSGKEMYLTSDHPLPTSRGRVLVKDIIPGDIVPKTGFGNARIVEHEEIEKVEFIGLRNRYGYDLETESDHFDVSGINSHNCRTLLGKDRFGMGYRKTGRGNISPATMNLTKLGIQYGICLGERDKADIKGFWTAFDNLLDVTRVSLKDRYNYICMQNIKAGKFMYENNNIADSEEALKHKDISIAMRHGTLAFGFIGLSNMLYAMFGKYQNQSKEALDFGLKVVKRIYDYAKKYSDIDDLNYSVYSTPAEGSCKTICAKLQKEYGKIKGVTDREYLNNSYHVPVYEKVSIKDKIDIETQFAKYCTGGTITYVELDATVMHNEKAVEDIIKYAMKHNVAYAAINIPIDICLNCGYKGVFDDSCPKCKSTTGITHLRRVTGYLTVSVEKMNSGKQAEVHDRVKHSKYTDFSKLK